MTLREDQLDFIRNKWLNCVNAKVIQNKKGCCKRGMLQQPLFAFTIKEECAVGSDSQVPY